MGNSIKMHLRQKILLNSFNLKKVKILITRPNLSLKYRSLYKKIVQLFKTKFLYDFPFESIECGPQCTLVTGSAVTRGRGRGTGES